MQISLPHGSRAGVERHSALPESSSNLVDVFGLCGTLPGSPGGRKIYGSTGCPDLPLASYAPPGTWVAVFVPGQAVHQHRSGVPNGVAAEDGQRLIW